MHRCSQPIRKEVEKRDAVERKRSEVESLRRSLSERKMALQGKYDTLMQRAITIRQFYEKQVKFG